MRAPPRRLAPLLLLPATLPLLARARTHARPRLEQLAERLETAATVSPAELATELWGEDAADSHSAGAQRVRTAARELFPEAAPGHGGEWRLTPPQVRRIEKHLRES